MKDAFVDANIVTKDPIQVLVLCETKMFKINASSDVVNKSHSNANSQKDKGISLAIPLKCLKKVENQKGMMILTIAETSGKRSKIRLEIESRKIQEKIYHQIHELFR